jgi:hypothetical protein
VDEDDRDRHTTATGVVAWEASKRTGDEDRVADSRLQKKSG